MSIKQAFIAVAIPVTLLASAGAFAGTQDCATRIRVLQTKIDHAKRFGNTNQAIRQQAALEQIRARCTDAGQRARAERKIADRQHDLQDARNAVSDAQARVDEAVALGDAKKVNKARRKLADKQSKLHDATRDLHDAQADRAVLGG